MKIQIPEQEKMITVTLMDGRTMQVPESSLEPTIVFVGLDVHKDSFSACCFTKANERYCGDAKLAPTAAAVVRYIERMKKSTYSETTKFVVAYEAGGAGYALCRELRLRDVDCVILAPTTMRRTVQEDKMKTDRRDARMIARCHAFGLASEVAMLTPEDEAVRDYIRMRDDHKGDLKRCKQRIIALCRRKGLEYTETKSYWTAAHIKWLDNVELDEIDRKTLNEYMISYRTYTDRIAEMDREIEKLARRDRYRDLVANFRCLAGIDTHVALSAASEVGDFRRFAKAMNFASYIGLVPSEYSSGSTQQKGGITKTGNTHLRRLLLEAANCAYSSRLTPGKKSRALRERQEGRPPEIVAYADRALIRLRKRAHRMTQEGKNANVIKAAVARELACFLWGMATGNIA